MIRSLPGLRSAHCAADPQSSERTGRPVAGELSRPANNLLPPPLRRHKADSHPKCPYSVRCRRYVRPRQSPGRPPAARGPRHRGGTLRSRPHHGHLRFVHIPRRKCHCRPHIPLHFDALHDRLLGCRHVRFERGQRTGAACRWLLHAHEPRSGHLRLRRGNVYDGRMPQLRLDVQQRVGGGAVRREPRSAGPPDNGRGERGREEHLHRNDDDRMREMLLRWRRHLRQLRFASRLLGPLQCDADDEPVHHPCFHVLVFRPARLDHPLHCQQRRVSSAQHAHVFPRRLPGLPPLLHMGCKQQRPVRRIAHRHLRHRRRQRLPHHRPRPSRDLGPPARPHPHPPCPAGCRPAALRGHPPVHLGGVRGDARRHVIQHLGLRGRHAGGGCRGGGAGVGPVRGMGVHGGRRRQRGDQAAALRNGRGEGRCGHQGRRLLLAKSAEEDGRRSSQDRIYFIFGCYVHIAEGYRTESSEGQRVRIKTFHTTLAGPLRCIQCHTTTASTRASIQSFATSRMAWVSTDFDSWASSP